MKIDFSKTLTALDGKDLIDAGKPLTLATVTVNALLAIYQDEQTTTGEEKIKRFRLADRVNDGRVQEITVEEAALMKELIAKAFGPLIVGRAYEIIESDVSLKKVTSA